MNMLIIGNGFDLAHDRPTRYEDFLKFAEQIVRTKNHHGTKDEFESTMPDLHTYVREYILSAFDTRQNPGSESASNKNEIVQELYERLDKNIWWTYFRYIQANDFARGKNWVDFESEIRTIIEFLDHQIKDLYDQLPPSARLFPDVTRKVEFFWSQLDFSNYKSQKQRDESYQYTYLDLIRKTYQDLENLIRCLEIYLDDCVVKAPITCYSSDIQELKIDSVLSFNYTSIPTDIYPSLTNTHYIHGRSKSDRPAAENNMVLGVNEYWDDHEKNSRTNFNCYKKFVQRIIKETGIGYKSTLKEMLSDYKDYDHLSAKTKGYIGLKYNNIYIFGHSLDTTDGDILREIILTEGIITTIFYRNKQQQSDQIANLSKILGQDELLKRVFSTSPTIIFKQQAKMASWPAT